MKYVIFSEFETSENQGEPMFWSNENGWGDLSSATVFTEADNIDEIMMPLPRDSQKINLPQY